MARIPEETIEEVRNAVNIADYIGQFVQLKKRGQNLFGLCPFHDENTPSFTVNEQKQIFHCFSCGRGGSVFEFVMERDQLAFPLAIQKVADYVGITVNVDTNAAQTTPHESAADKRQKEILKTVEQFMHHLLVSTEGGTPGRAYVEQRGMTPETIEHFGIGFAPEDGTLLRTLLETQNVTIEEQRATGLFVERDGGELISRFTNRVMFPLRNRTGDTVGFSGRTLTSDKNVAKYLNSPETGLFKKGELIFNLDEAIKGRGNSKDRHLYLLEGYMDVIAVYQTGITSGIASMGTSLTPDQVRIIGRNAGAVTICYDGDSAGQHATMRALDMFDESTVDVTVAVLPGELDPDEFITQHGAEAFAKQIQTVLTPIAFKLQYLASGVDMNNDHAKLEYIAQALTAIQAENSSIAQTLALQQLAETTGIPIATLQEQLTTTTPHQASAPAPATSEWSDNDLPPEAYGDSDFGAPPPASDLWTQPDYQAGPAAPVVAAPKLSRFDKAQRALLYYMMTDAETSIRVTEGALAFPQARFQEVMSAWCEYVATSPVTLGFEPDSATFVGRQTGELAVTVAEILSLQLPPIQPITIDQLIDVVQEGQTDAMIAETKQEMNRAKRLGDKQRQSELAGRYFELLRLAKTHHD